MSLVVLRPLNTNTWAGVTHYKNCHEDLCPYLLQNGKRYTGFDEASKEDQKIRKDIEKAIHTDLAPDSIYWDTFFIRVGEQDIVLNTEDPMDLLKIQFLKNNDFVKSSLAENKAQARYVLVNDEAEAEQKNKKRALKKQALDELEAMSETDIRDALRLYGVRSEDLKPSVASSTLADYVEQDPKKFIRMWVENTSRKTQVLIERGIARGIVRRTNLMYLYGTTNLGKSIEEAVAFIDSLENQEVKIGLGSALKS